MDSVCKERVKDEDVERWKGRGLNLAVPLFFAGHQSGTICSLEVLQLNFLGSDSLKIHLHTLPVLHIKREREGVNERMSEKVRERWREREREREMDEFCECMT